MTREEHIAWLKAIRDSISGGDEEFDNKRRKSLDAGISALLQEPCERFEWGIDGNVYKITKAKDGKEICQQVCNDAISRQAVLDKTIRKNSIWNSITNSEGKNLEEIIFELPSVTQKSGKWHIAHGMYEDRFWCSCGYIRIMDSRMNEWKYCPVCGGAKMESEDK